MIEPASLDLSALPSVSLQDRRQLPAVPAIYFVISNDGAVQYIGRSVNPRQRWQNHHRYSQLRQQSGVKIAYLACNSELLDEIESALIEWFDPPLNGLQVRSLKERGHIPEVRCQLAALIDAHNLRVSRTGEGERLSQRLLASRAGVAVTTINRLYNNTARRFDADVIEKLCRTLECTPGDLLVLWDEGD